MQFVGLLLHEKENEEKYPTEKARGKADKYDKL